MFEVFIFCLMLNPNQITSVGFEIMEDTDQYVQTKNWCYLQRSCGEANWKDRCAHEQHQSPINFLTENRYIHIFSLVHGFNRNAYKFPGFDVKWDKGFTVDVRPFSINTKKTAFNVIPSSCPGYSNYHFHSMHFHWGHQDDVGSEHTINEKSFPMELHLVYKCDAYINMDNAVQGKGGIAVVAFLIDIAPSTGSGETTYFLEPIIARLKGDIPADIHKDPLDATSLFKFDKAFMYQGSLTTPPCGKDSVQWIVYKTPIIIPRSHILAFRNLRQLHQTASGDNFRTLKPIPYFEENDGSKTVTIAYGDMTYCDVRSTNAEACQP